MSYLQYFYFLLKSASWFSRKVYRPQGSKVTSDKHNNIHYSFVFYHSHFKGRDNRITRDSRRADVCWLWPPEVHWRSWWCRIWRSADPLDSEEHLHNNSNTIRTYKHKLLWFQINEKYWKKDLYEYYCEESFLILSQYMTANLCLFRTRLNNIFFCHLEYYPEVSVVLSPWFPCVRSQSGFCYEEPVSRRAKTCPGKY